MFEIGNVSNSQLAQDVLKRLFRDTNEWRSYRDWEVHEEHATDPKKQILQDLQQNFFNAYCKNYKNADGIETMQCAFLRVPTAKAEGIARNIEDLMELTQIRMSGDGDNVIGLKLQNFANTTKNKDRTHDAKENPLPAVSLFAHPIPEEENYMCLAIFAHSRARTLVAADILHQDSYRKSRSR